MDANFLWREAIKLKRTAREEGMRQVAAQKRAAALADSRMSIKGYRIKKASKKMKERSDKLKVVLLAGIKKERAKAQTIMD